MISFVRRARARSSRGRETTENSSSRILLAGSSQFRYIIERERTEEADGTKRDTERRSVDLCFFEGPEFGDLEISWKRPRRWIWSARRIENRLYIRLIKFSKESFRLMFDTRTRRRGRIDF